MIQGPRQVKRNRGYLTRRLPTIRPAIAKNSPQFALVFAEIVSSSSVKLEDPTFRYFFLMSIRFFCPV